jgi:outer membrane protein
MKKMMKLVPLSLGIIMMAFCANAQTLKLGHVNSAEILALMPEAKVADGELQKFGASLESQLKTMGAEYQAKLQDYQSKQELMADAIKQTKEKEIGDLENRIREFQQTAQESVQNKKQELYAPILKKAEEAIKATAKENNYTYILDSSGGVILYSESSTDIGPLVKKKMGLPDVAPAKPMGAPGTPAKPTMKK